jgi:hypothetical protein
MTLALKRMNDEQLGKIERHIDAWIGEIPFEFPCSATKTVRFRIRAGENGPSIEQRQLVDGLAVRYEILCPQISQKLAELCAENRGVVSEQLPKPRLLLSVPGVIGSEVFDFLLGYEFDGEEAEGTGYFFGYSGWGLKSAVKAS